MDRVYDDAKFAGVTLDSGRAARFSYTDTSGRRRYVRDVPPEYRVGTYLTAKALERAKRIYGPIPLRKQTPRRRSRKTSLLPGNLFQGTVFPGDFRNLVRDEIVRDPMLNDAIVALMPRASEIGGPLAALLAGIYMNRWAREKADDLLDRLWSRPPTIGARTLVVGGGLHAAVFAAAYKRSGRGTVTVIERGRVGGVFATTRKPAFYLNSRNRPGTTGTPGDRTRSLNYLPGAVVQMAALSGNDYPTNDQAAWAIRMTLAAYANVFKGDVRDWSNFRRQSMTVDTGGFSLLKINGTRAIITNGLGKPLDPFGFKAKDRVIDYLEFMSRMDSPFPLRGMNRVAVIGAGDSGRTVIEALTGQGPQPQMSVASLDWPQRIDWYGVPASCRTKDSWEQTNRTRYKEIGSLLTGDPPRVRALDPTTAVSVGYDCAFVNDIPYDCVVLATGFDSTRTVALPGTPMFRVVNGRAVASGRGTWDLVGPTALIPDTEGERNLLGGIAENSVAIWRYAPRTAAYAASL